MVGSRAEFETLLDKIRGIVSDEGGRDEKLLAVCDILRGGVSYFDWVGFYIADREQRVLHLGPYVGESAEHTRIPFAQGICGQVAESESPLIVQDVSKETNYLSCSQLVKSEIVVPVFRYGNAVGQIDIDSHTAAAFSGEDEEFLVRVCEVVSNLF